jgi:molybdenum cofactor synthesis domain-containing protein
VTAATPATAAGDPHGRGAWRARVVTVSDGVAAGVREDRGGPAVVAALEAAGARVDPVVVVVGDGVEEVARVLRQVCAGFAGLVVTTGGTGFGPRDLTPEATRQVIDRDAPGLAEAMRAVNPLGRLSRGLAGTVDRALVVNVPGSPGGAVECLGAVVDVVPHALRLLQGDTAH